MINWVYLALQIMIAMISVGGIAYYLIAIVAARKLVKARAVAFASPASLPPFSLLKPLYGADPDLESHLESFFRQDYPHFEIIFAVGHESDRAAPIVRRLLSRYPQIPAQLIFTGEPPYANAKVYRMEKMAEAAEHPILVITDSDASVSPVYLRHLAAAFAAANVGAVTNLYRGVAGAEFWSKLEALGMSTEFMAGVIVADRLEGMKFMLGPSMAIRAEALRAIGGFAAMADYLADDFVMGQRVAEAGYRVALSTYVINHHASASGFSSSFKHRLFWNRSSRFSRPSGYIGQGFTYGLCWAMLLCLIAPQAWSGGILMAALTTRVWLAFELAVRLLEDRFALRRVWLIPLQDLLSFTTWIGGFLGKEIIWRNDRYQLLDGGRLAPAVSRQSSP
jgi:ceramide glucosyltransferase